ncbi:MAG: ABC transporter permease [Chthonomonadales bacterium]|nr:ABC transporter permease [Chthonomonadales bacterium]
MWRRVAAIAGHEYVTSVRRREFLLVTLGLPVLMLVFGGLSLLATTAATGAFRKPALRRVGIVDPGGRLKAPRAGEREDARISLVASAEEGKRRVREGGLSALLVVAPDYVRSGKVTVYRKEGGLLNRGDRVPVGSILTRALLAGMGTDPTLAARLVEPTGAGASVYVLDKHGRFVPRDVGREAAGFAVPYGFTLLLTTAIFFSAAYLLRGVAEEKENRVIEVILSSVTADELLAGKLLGLAGVGLTQIGIWTALGIAPLAMQFSRYVRLPALSLIEVLLFFLLGYAFYATIMAGLGSLGTSYRESQQIASSVSFGAFFPMILIPALIEFPNGTLARVLSVVPFTAPTTMVLRLTAADVPVLDIAVSALVLALSTWAVLRLSARLFRFGLLIYGKRPTFRETLRWLRSA